MRWRRRRRESGPRPLRRRAPKAATFTRFGLLRSHASFLGTTLSIGICRAWCGTFETSPLKGSAVKRVRPKPYVILRCIGVGLASGEYDLDESEYDLPRNRTSFVDGSDGAQAADDGTARTPRRVAGCEGTCTLRSVRCDPQGVITRKSPGTNPGDFLVLRAFRRGSAAADNPVLHCLGDRLGLGLG